MWTNSSACWCNHLAGWLREGSNKLTLYNTHYWCHKPCSLHHVVAVFSPHSIFQCLFWVLYSFMNCMRFHSDLTARTHSLDHSLHPVLFCLSYFVWVPVHISPHMISSAINEQKCAPFVCSSSSLFPIFYGCSLKVHSPPVQFASSLHWHRRWTESSVCTSSWTTES